MPLSLVDHGQEILSEVICLLESDAGLAKSGQILSLHLIQALRIARHPSHTAVVAEIFWRRCGLADTFTSACLSVKRLALNGSPCSRVALFLDFALTSPDRFSLQRSFATGQRVQTHQKNSASSGAFSLLERVQTKEGAGWFAARSPSAAQSPWASLLACVTRRPVESVRLARIVEPSALSPHGLLREDAILRGKQPVCSARPDMALAFDWLP